MVSQGLAKAQINKLSALMPTVFSDTPQWEAKLIELDITSPRHVQIATEGAMLGSLFEYEFKRNLFIISDDAGQFNILNHALCWIHAERMINKLVGFNEKQIEARFERIFTKKTCFETLNQALKRIYNNKSELLFVLERPDIPLHNNLSENDIREYVKKRKISASTRSRPGRRCRDTFTSLKKTCRKLGVSFWEYVKDRVTGENAVPRLSDLIRKKTLELAF